LSWPQPCSRRITRPTRTTTRRRRPAGRSCAAGVGPRGIRPQHALRGSASGPTRIRRRRPANPGQSFCRQANDDQLGQAGGSAGSSMGHPGRNMGAHGRRPPDGVQNSQRTIYRALASAADCAQAPRRRRRRYQRARARLRAAVRQRSRARVVQRTYYVGGRPKPVLSPVLLHGLPSMSTRRSVSTRPDLRWHTAVAAPINYNWAGGNPWFGTMAVTCPYPSYQAQSVADRLPSSTSCRKPIRSEWMRPQPQCQRHHQPPQRLRRPVPLLRGQTVISDETAATRAGNAGASRPSPPDRRANPNRLPLRRPGFIAQLCNTSSSSSVIVVSADGQQCLQSPRATCATHPPPVPDPSNPRAGEQDLGLQTARRCRSPRRPAEMQNH